MCCTFVPVFTRMFASWSSHLRPDGLIGSKPKRAQFERRLAARGAPETDLARVTCPIGAQSGLSSKEPGAIAVGVGAEMLGVRERLRAASESSTVRALPRRQERT